MANEDPFDIKKQDGLLGGALATTQQQTTAPETRTTEANQDLTKGTLDVKDDGVFFTPYKTKTGEDTVAGQMTGLLANESPYMTSARSNAQQAANSRGLLNSTMAATAGEKAAIDSALPIAQQDAGYFQNQGLSAQSTDSTSRLQKEQGDIQKGLYETQGDISSRLQSEAAQQKGKLSYQEHLQAKNLQNAELKFEQIKLDAQVDVEKMKLSQEQQTVFNDTVNSISDDYMQDYMEIMLNPNFKTPEDRQKAIDVLAENSKQRYAAAAAIAGVNLAWDIPSEVVAEQTQAPEVPTPTNTAKPNYEPSPNGEWTWNEQRSTWVWQENNYQAPDGG